MTVLREMILVCGPCQIESVEHVVMMAALIKAVSDKLKHPIIFKASFDKANRMSGLSPRGAGIDVAIEAFKAIRRDHRLKILTDVHEVRQVEKIAPFVDILQIPALLCRQTDLITAAGRTGKTVNIKKGQFASPDAMVFAVEKAREGGSNRVWLTERGSFFGYGDLVVDMRSISQMARHCDAVIFDATHSVQRPGGNLDSSGGDPEMTEPLARAAVAAGVTGLFVETHQDPAKAPSDGAVMMPVQQLSGFLSRMVKLHDFVRQAI